MDTQSSFPDVPIMMKNYISSVKYTVVLCFITYVVMGVSTSILGPTLPPLSAAIGLSIVGAGVLRAGRQIGQFIAGVSAGRSLDRLPTKLLLILGGLLMIVGLTTMAFSNAPSVAISGAVVWGIGHGLLEMGPNYLVGRHFGDKAAKPLAALHGVYGISAIFGPLLVAAIRVDNWQFSYIGIVVAAVILIIFYLPIRLSKPSDTPLTEEPKLSGKFSLGLFLPAALIIFIFNGSNSGVADWTYTHLTLAGNASHETAALVTSVYWLALAISRIGNVFTLARGFDLQIVIVSSITSVIGALIVVLAGADVVWMSIGIGLIGIGFGPIYPVILSEIGTRAPDDRGKSTGLLAATAASGAVVLPVLQGWIGGGHSGGFGVVLFSTCVIFLVILAFYFLGDKYERGITAA